MGLHCRQHLSKVLSTSIFSYMPSAQIPKITADINNEKLQNTTQLSRVCKYTKHSLIWIDGNRNP